MFYSFISFNFFSSLILLLLSVCLISYAWIYDTEKNVRLKVSLRLCFLFPLFLFWIQGLIKVTTYCSLFVGWLIRAMSLLPIPGKAAKAGELLALSQCFVYVSGKTPAQMKSWTTIKITFVFRPALSVWIYTCMIIHLYGFLYIYIYSLLRVKQSYIFSVLISL